MKKELKGDLLEVFHRNWDEKPRKWVLKSLQAGSILQEKEGVRTLTAPGMGVQKETEIK